MGIEPTIFRLEVGCLIHLATGADVVLKGLEPLTSRLLDERSDQLSYKTFYSMKSEYFQHRAPLQVGN